MNQSNKKLRTRYNYKHFGDTCKNCRHFNSEENLADGVWADTCHLDDPQEVYILNNPWGVCDEHERTHVRRDSE